MMRRSKNLSETDYLLTYLGTKRLEEIIQERMENECLPLGEDTAPQDIQIKRLSVTKIQNGREEGVFRGSFTSKITQNLVY